MNHKPLQIGDRVALRETLLGLPVGTGGTVVHIYRHAESLYAVQFDKAQVPLPTHREQLTRLLQARDRAVAEARSEAKHRVVS
jgi:hypothetical protein